MTKKLTKLNIELMFFAILLICLMPVNTVAYASNELTDGVYEIAFTSDLSDMGMMAFENKAKKLKLEKIGDNYYITASFDSSKVKDIKLLDSKGKVGEIITLDGIIERHTYTINKNNINKPMKFSIFIKEPMNKTKEFTIAPVVSKATRIADVDSKVDRPAEYVPEIDLNVNNDEFETGSTYFITKPKSVKLCGEDLEYSIKAYYIQAGEKVELDITNDKLLLENVGEYHIVYLATSDKYKTLLGKNTSSEIDIKITSKIGAKSIVKIEYDKGILPDETQVKANIIANGNVFDKASNAMVKYSDHFEVISIDLLNQNGEIVNPTKAINVYLLANETYNRNNIEVYLLNEDGSTTKCTSEGYGRYVKINTDKVGTFIICVPGVKFVMPMYGYALITVFGVILVVVAIVVPIVVVKKNKKKEMIANGTYIEKSKNRKSK